MLEKNIYIYILFITQQVSGAVADVLIKHGETVKFGEHELEVRSTPGHTNGTD